MISRLGGLAALVLASILALPAAFAQVSPTSLNDAIRGYEAAAHRQFRGLPEDWTTHHVIFSQAAIGSAKAAAAQKDPRYWLAQIRARIRSGGAAGPELAQSTVTTRGQITSPLQDWSVFLGKNAKAGADSFPANFTASPDGAPSCANDFVAFNTGLEGSSSQASIIAYNQLYDSTCAGAVPSTFWAYNTGGTITMSPVLSMDGTELAFVQSVWGVATLVVLRWAPGGTVGAPVTPSIRTGGSCTTPCMVSLTLSGSPGDTTSTPYYDYGSDTLFVGDANGKLHKFNPVFDGFPAEVTTGGFPAQVSSCGQPLADPVYDSTTGTVLVGDGPGNGDNFLGQTNAEVHAIDGATGAVVNSAPVCAAQAGFRDAPLLDPDAGEVYFTCGQDAGGGACSSSDACLRQFNVTAISGSSGTPEPIGASACTLVATGAFDNIYIDSNGATSSGDLYVCGNPGGTATLYRIPITDNAMATPVAAATLTSKSAIQCSPVTEFYDGVTQVDRIFMSVAADGSQKVCTNSSGCVYSFDVTAPLTAGAVAVAGIASQGGASGIVVDNVGTPAQTQANVYFTTGGNQTCSSSGGTGGCAIQAARNGL